MKKAQAGKTVTIKKTTTATPREKKNIEDATKMKNMRPVFKSGGAVSYKQAQKAAGLKSGGKMGKCKSGCN